MRTALAADSRVRFARCGNDGEQVYEEILRLKPNAAIIRWERAPSTRLRQSSVWPANPWHSVISAGQDASPDLILRSLRAVRAIPTTAISTEELKTVLDRIEEFCAVALKRQEERPHDRVFSSKGGCGTSFIATNLAAATAAPTILVDLNLQAGDLPLFLGIDAKYSMADMAEHRTKTGWALITSLVAPYSSNLSLLAAPKEADAADDISSPNTFFEVLERLRENFDWVVLIRSIPLTPSPDSHLNRPLDQSDDDRAGADADIPAISQYRKGRANYRPLGYPPRKKIRIIVKRWSNEIRIATFCVRVEVPGRAGGGACHSQ